jgi:hypothetical protein
MTPPSNPHTVSAPKNHDLQLYPNDEALVTSLADYVAAGFNKEECVVVIATLEHLEAVRRRLANDFDLDLAISLDKYMPIDAATFLQTFLVNDWPVKDLFIKAVTPVLERAYAGKRAVRAFGEMVVLLWKKRLHGATVQLEQLWNDLAHHYDFKLLCAYPQSAFDHGLESALQHICKAHSETVILSSMVKS